jgi:hypothetical protein
VGGGGRGRGPEGKKRGKSPVDAFSWMGVNSRVYVARSNRCAR